MGKIWTKQFQLLSDHMDIYQFMLEIYDKNWKNGVPAPFYEYALSAIWMDKSYTYLNRLWLDDNKIVGFVFYEDPVTDVYFSLRPGYGNLAQEMVEYADQYMPDFNRNRQFIIFEGQKEVIAAALKSGYQKIDEATDLQFDFCGKLDLKLPDGFHFVPYEEQDVRKRAICCWKGFDHESDKGLWIDEDKYISGTEWTPANQLKNCYQIRQAPHQTCRYDVVIANRQDEYVCVAGMWWIPENKLAYMEPLCTIPEYRRQGLAAAALSELYRKTKELGATHMTGGMDAFYTNLGFQPAVVRTYWKKS